MAKKQQTKSNIKGKKHYRINDMTERYRCSRSHIPNLIKAKVIPEPLIIGGIKLWPAKFIDAIDQEREKEYYKSLREQGFHIPDDLQLSK